MRVHGRIDFNEDGLELSAYLVCLLDCPAWLSICFLLRIEARKLAKLGLLGWFTS